MKELEKIEESQSPEKLKPSEGFMARFNIQNESNRKMIVINHSRKRDSMADRYLAGLEGNKKLDNPLISFEFKDKLGEKKAAKEKIERDQVEDAHAQREKVRRDKLLDT